MKRTHHPDAGDAATRRAVLVLGASGNVGSALTDRLATAGAKVRAFYDPSNPRNPTFDSSVTQIPGTFDDAATLNKAMQGVDAVFMLTPPSASQVRWQRNIAAAAHDQDVRRIVKLSAFETGKSSELQMGRWHHDGELAVAESGCEYVILRPQYFMQMQNTALRSAVRTGILTGAASGPTQLGMVDADDIAAVAAVALTATRYDGDLLVPTGPSAVSFDDMAAELSQVLGRGISYQRRPEDEVRAEFTRRGWADWHIEDYLKIHGTAASPQVTSCVQEVTGVAPTSFAAFLRKPGILSPDL